MNLEQYMKILRARVAQFEEDWKTNQSKKKDPYPKELDSIEEWDEQFEAFVTTECR